MTVSKGHIPNEFIERLLARVDIVDVINARVPLKKKGKEYSACCPFHNEKTPSFTVSSSKQFYHCFGCGVTGNVVKFLMEYESLDFIEAVETLAQMDGQSVPYESSSKSYSALPNINHENKLLEWVTLSAQYYELQLRQHPQKERAVDYIQKRGISAQIAARFGLGYAPPGWNGLLNYLQTFEAQDADIIKAGLVTQSENNKVYDRFRDRLMFPIRNRKGQVIAFGGRILDKPLDLDSLEMPQGAKYLNSPETPFFHKGDELYGLYEMRMQLRQIEYVIVVEGYMDVLMLANFGIENVVATLGTATSTHQIERLFKVCKRIVFCFDGDRAGKDAAWKALNSGLSTLKTGRELAFLFLPDGEDPDSLVQSEGKELFLERVNHAISLSQYLLDHLEISVNSDSLEGRSEVLSLGNKLIAQLPDTPLKDMLYESLRERLDISEAVFTKHTQTLGTQSDHNNNDYGHENTQQNLPKKSYQFASFKKSAHLNTPYFKMRYAEKQAKFKYKNFDLLENKQIFPNNVSFFERPRGKVEKALIIILGNIGFARRLKTVDFLINAKTFGASLLFSVIRSIQTQTHIQNSAQLLQHFEGLEAQSWLLDLTLAEHIFEDEQLQYDELVGILVNLHQENDPKLLALNKLRSGETLTEEELSVIRLKD